MRFYQKIRFRLIAGTVLLVLAVAVLLTWHIQGVSREVLRKHEFEHLFDKTNLRFREVSAEIQTLREDITGLVNGPAVRRLQWAQQYRRGWVKSHPDGMDDPEYFIRDSFAKANVD